MSQRILAEGTEWARRHGATQIRTAFAPLNPWWKKDLGGRQFHGRSSTIYFYADIGSRPVEGLFR
jgi:hypothetical protein